MSRYYVIPDHPEYLRELGREIEDRPKRAKQMSPAFCWDFTLWIPQEQLCQTPVAEGVESEELKDLKATLTETLDLISNDWVFQLEQGEGSDSDDEDGASGSESEDEEEEERTARYHFQGRFRCKKQKKRLTALKKAFKDTIMATAHLSVTSSANVKNNFYVTKEDTRIAGPWFSASYHPPEEYVPRQVRHINKDNLRPWQKEVFEDIQKFNDRQINVIVDRKGNVGKSSFLTWCSCHVKGVIEVPPVHDFKDVCQFVSSIVIQRGRGAAQTLFVDFPRARDQTKIHQFMAGIENLKNGSLFETRYTAKSIKIDSPNIWMFTNTVLKLNYVSFDRWRFYTINKDLELVPLELKSLRKKSTKSLEEYISKLQGIEEEEYNDEVEFVEDHGDYTEEPAQGGMDMYKHNPMKKRDT